MKCQTMIDHDCLYSRDEEEVEGCLLERAHAGYHLNKLNDGRYFSWGGFSCDDNCDWCGECFNYLTISEKEAQLIIQGRQKNYDD